MTATGFSNKPKPRSPLKERPRRQAGQSLRDEVFFGREGAWMYAGGAAVGAVLVAAVYWGCVWLNPKATSWMVSLSAFTVCVAGVGLSVAQHRASKRIRQGLDGEVTVGQMLERLRAMGYEVLHDIPGEREGTNIDHVLIGPGGVFVIETKTWSKVGNQQITYDWQSIAVDGQDRSAPLAQARACRDDMRRRIHRQLGREDVPVRAVVVFPGWYVNGPKSRSGPEDVWVLNPGGLEKWLANEALRLEPQQIARLAMAFTR